MNRVDSELPDADPDKEEVMDPPPEYEYESADTLDANYYQTLRKNKPLILRLIWLVCFGVMLLLCGYMVYLLISDYASYPSYNELTSSFTTALVLPAITICNMNPLNKTSLSSKMMHLTTGETLYTAYQSLAAFYEDGSTANYTGITVNSENVHRDHSMNIQTQLLDYTRFSKQKITLTTFLKDGSTTHSTEYGDCLEINDPGSYSQEVDGPTGSLELVLDAKIDNYMSSTTSEGYQIFLRMSGESVLNKGFGFSVKPGEHTMVNLKKTYVTRLPAPYGTCSEDASLYDPSRMHTIKECYMTNILLYFLQSSSCKCWPWYFEDRFMEPAQQIEQIQSHGVTVEQTLVDHWISGGILNVSTNLTCQKLYSFNGTVLGTVSVADYNACATECYKKNKCVGFEFDKTVDAESTCTLYDKNARLVGALEQDTTLQYGLINCTDTFTECEESTYLQCENMRIDAELNAQSSPLCSEPCSYIDYTYTLSTSTFPAKNTWSDDLDINNVTSYHSVEEARMNLVKITLYYETLIDYYNTQTASYEIQNFIAEVGGLFDGLVGLSFFTIWQLLEWGLLSIYRKQKKATKEEEEGKNENIVMDNMDREASEKV